MKIESEKYTKLIADGFCVFEQVLEDDHACKRTSSQ